MFRALWMKESVKLRWGLLALVLLHLAVIALTFLEVRRLFSLDHAETVWYNLVVLKQIPYGTFRLLGLVTALVLACLQYAPETAGGKLRLSLHLPCPTWAMVACHMGAGLLALLIPLALDFVGLTVLMSAYYPFEVLVDTWAATSLWALGAVSAYLALAGAFLEPQRGAKLWYLCLGAGVIGLMLRRYNPGSAWPLVLWGLFFLALQALGNLHAAYRFRYRRVA